MSVRPWSETQMCSERDFFTNVHEGQVYLARMLTQQIFGELVRFDARQVAQLVSCGRLSFTKDELLHMEAHLFWLTLKRACEGTVLRILRAYSLCLVRVLVTRGLDSLSTNELVSCPAVNVRELVAECARTGPHTPVEVVQLVLDILKLDAYLELPGVGILCRGKILHDLPSLKQWRDGDSDAQPVSKE